MSTILPHIEDSSLTVYYPPAGDYIGFEDNEHYEKMLKEWGLNTSKKTFWYKGKSYQREVTIVGYEKYGVTAEFHTLVIQFQDGNLSCIFPARLKEMQQASFVRINESATDGETTPSPKKTATKENSTKSSPATTTKKAAPKKEKAPKLELPEEKVHFTGTVKQFALTYNHFNETNDEVIIFENITIHQEEPIEVDYAWASHSKTLQKHELSTGQQLEFDGKIAHRKLPKGKDVEDESLISDVTVSYKLNNPSKIKKI
ncbi:hypothetical protein CN918_26745 [Priestia megaterium]|nr:hypothetical protein CN918_26745 [Priestia megaterium]